MKSLSTSSTVSNSSAQFRTERGPGWLIVRLSPANIDTTEVRSLADRLCSLLDQHCTHRLLLDMSEVSTLPNALVDQLAVLRERLIQHDGTLRICGLNDSCDQRLTESRGSHHLVNYPTQQHAVQQKRHLQPR